MAMSGDDQRNENDYVALPPARNDAATPAPSWSIFSLPAPLKRVFDQFPLRQHAANDLPIRAPTNREKHVLHVFTTAADAKALRPSYNPGCLKWQAYLRFAGLPFSLVPSNNHASPSGALPFLQPASSDAQSINAPDPIPSNQLKKWISSQKTMETIEESPDLRYEAYASLVDNRIRKAWLYQLYLTPQNADLMHRLYVAPCSSHPLVQLAIASQLRTAAETELVKSAAKTTISTYDLFKDAEEAFSALSTLLGSEDYFFFSQQKPGLFDANVFAYTALILQQTLGWTYNPLEELLSKHQNLVQHRDRILDLYF